MATTKQTTTTISRNKTTKPEPKTEVKELHYVLVNPLFTPIETTKEHYEELKRLNKIIESKDNDTIYFRLDV